MFLDLRDNLFGGFLEVVCVDVVVVVGIFFDDFIVWIYYMDVVVGGN